MYIQVAKDDQNIRACHVIEAGDDAKNIIATMGQAFEIRYKKFLEKEGKLKGYVLFFDQPLP